MARVGSGQYTYEAIEHYALQVFQYGQTFCGHRGLALVDTKYEFGTVEGQLCLIDELHTPDSSRFWPLKEGVLEEGEWQDREYIRQWLLAHPNPD